MLTSEHNGPFHAAALSVVIPCYNAEHYIARCLDSILADPQDGIEIICVNDGSSDDTSRILHAYAACHSDSIVVLDQENKGAWHARISGIKRATGRYISFVDADDEVFPAYSKALYAKATESNADLVVCGFQRYDVNARKVVSREFCSERAAFILRDDPGRLLGVNPAPWNKAYRADLLKSIPELHETPIMFDDLVLLLLACLRMNGPIVFLADCLVKYNVRDTSLINNVTSGQVEGARRVITEVRSYYQEANNESLLEMLATEAFLHLGISMLFRISGNPEVDIREEVGRVDSFLDAAFPGWRDSRYLTLRYALGHGPAIRKLWAASTFYRVGLMPVFLSLYKKMTRLIGRDIKW